MKLNRSTDMALRVVMLVAVRRQRMTVDELAVDLALPRNHVAKVVQRLQRLGALETTRGRTGGIELAADLDRLTVGQLVRDFEGDAEVVECDQQPCPLRSGCRLRSALRQAQLAFFATLDRVTLRDLIAEPTGPLLLGLPTRPPG